jgi:outer membrane beta-barrel protein
MKKIAIVFLNLVIMSGFAGKAICQDSDQQEKVHAIQERIYQKSHEFGITAGYIPDENYYEAFPVGAYYMFTFNEHFAWEVARAQWIFTSEKDLKKDLEHEFGVRPSEFSEPQYSIYSHAVFTPFYGKDAVLNRGIVNRETYFLLGGGIVNYDNKKSFEDSSSETAPSLSFGLGQKFFIKENYALNLELRNITNFREDDTEWRIYLGASFGFRFDLSPRKKQKDPKIDKLNHYLKED